MKTQEFKVGDVVQVTKQDLDIEGEIVNVMSYPNLKTVCIIRHQYGTCYASEDQMKKVDHD